MSLSQELFKQRMPDAREHVLNNLDETTIAQSLARAYDRIMDSSNTKSVSLG